MFNYKNILVCSLMLGLISCKKLIEISAPVNTITSVETFTSSANATAALMQIYSNMISGPDQVLTVMPIDLLHIMPDYRATN